MGRKKETRIIIFLRAPEKGKVKTRLARDLGDDAALKLHREFAEKTVAKAVASGNTCQISFYPAGQKELVENWLGSGFVYVPQSGADLGERMANALAAVFGGGSDQAVLVGIDIPQITPSLFTDAFELLDQMDAVLGPTLDGGYWLIGFNRDAFAPGVFRAMDWGTSRVFSATMTRMAAAGLSIGLLPELRDVDYLEDLRAVEAAIGSCSTGAACGVIPQENKA